jgi:hypothetical protein
MRTSEVSRIVSAEHETLVTESVYLLAQGSHGIICEFRELLVTMGLSRASQLLTILVQSTLEGFIGCHFIHDDLMLIQTGGKVLG